VLTALALALRCPDRSLLPGEIYHQPALLGLDGLADLAQRPQVGQRLLRRGTQAEGQLGQGIEQAVPVHLAGDQVELDIAPEQMVGEHADVRVVQVIQV
jgi:hypothetical protein